MPKFLLEVYNLEDKGDHLVVGDKIALATVEGDTWQQCLVNPTNIEYADGEGI